MTTSTLDRSTIDQMREAAHHLGHPEATVFVFNEDGDTSGPLEQVDLYGPTGKWVSAVYAQGRVNSRQRDESAAWRIFENMWDSLPSSTNRFEIAPADGPDTEHWKTGDPTRYTIHVVETNARGWEETVGVVLSSERDEGGTLWFATCAICQWTEPDTRFVLARQQARIHAITVHDAAVAGEQGPGSDG